MASAEARGAVGAGGVEQVSGGAAIRIFLCGGLGGCLLEQRLHLLLVHLASGWEQECADRGAVGVAESCDALWGRFASPWKGSSRVSSAQSVVSVPLSELGSQLQHPLGNTCHAASAGIVPVHAAAQVGRTAAIAATRGKLALAEQRFRAAAVMRDAHARIARFERESTNAEEEHSPMLSSDHQISSDEEHDPNERSFLEAALRVHNHAHCDRRVRTSGSSSSGESATLTGTVSYRERVALPPDAVAEVSVIDATVQDVAATVVAKTAVPSEGKQVPLPFTLQLRREPDRQDTSLHRAGDDQE